MQARALSQLSQTSPSKRLELLAPGLPKLVEHVLALSVEVQAMSDAGQHRSANIVDNLMQEEAAKLLILLDMVRAGVGNDDVVKKYVRAFYDHLSRCVMAEVATYRIASFGELREAVERLRRSHYLDGPNDVDWVFRNHLVATRENAMYVDYVQTDDGPSWISPGDYVFRSSGPSRVVGLIAALSRMGATTVDGLRLIEGLWRGCHFEDSDHWEVIRRRNLGTISALRAAGLASSEAKGDAYAVMDQWGFPTAQLELSMLKIDIDSLRDKQRATLEAIERDWYGY